MPKPVVILDLDDTISPFAQPFLDWYQEKYNHKLPKPKPHYSFTEAFGNPAEGNWVDIIDDYHASAPFDDIKPKKDAIEVLSRLADKFTFHIITSRPNVHREVTEEYIKEYLADYVSQLHMPTETNILANQTNKAELAESLNAVALVDDGVHNINDLEGYDIKPILYKPKHHHWGNMDVSDKATIVEDWDGVEEEQLKLL